MLIDAPRGQCITIQTVRQKSPPKGDGRHSAWVALGVGAATAYAQRRCGVAGLRADGCAVPDPRSDVWHQALRPRSSRRSPLSPFALVSDLSPSPSVVAFAIASLPGPFAQETAPAQRRPQASQRQFAWHTFHQTCFPPPSDTLRKCVPAGPVPKPNAPAPVARSAVSR